MRDAHGREVPRHTQRQRQAAVLRRAAAHQERARRLRAQHLQRDLQPRHEPVLSTISSELQILFNTNSRYNELDFWC